MVDGLDIFVLLKKIEKGLYKFNSENLKIVDIGNGSIKAYETSDNGKTKLLLHYNNLEPTLHIKPIIITPEHIKNVMDDTRSTYLCSKELGITQRKVVLGLRDYNITLAIEIMNKYWYDAKISRSEMILKRIPKDIINFWSFKLNRAICVFTNTFISRQESNSKDKFINSYLINTLDPLNRNIIAKYKGKKIKEASENGMLFLGTISVFKIAMTQLKDIDKTLYFYNFNLSKNTIDPIGKIPITKIVFYNQYVYAVLNKEDASNEIFTNINNTIKDIKIENNSITMSQLTGTNTVPIYAIKYNSGVKENNND